ncbi:uncharacterized protein [Clytia hemisphaerica]|uniref:C-type lectin domain-containing protein n=1 Tax=Clytia hemisphaerica TaxID=252671 RepID=A0A7M6DMN4_9CNID|eukprot:TCONS_00019274-protein
MNYSRLLQCFYLTSILRLAKANAEIKPCGDEAEGWIHYKSSCLVYVNKHLHFKEARKYCQGFLGGTADIVYNVDDTENEYIKTNMIRKDPIWIGLMITSQNSSSWIRNNGEGNFKNWAFSRPPFRNGDCSIMMESGFWLETNCNGEHPFVCKKESSLEDEDETRRAIIFITIPITMIVFIVIFVVLLFQRSQREIRKLKERLASSEVLHLIVSKPNPAHKKLNHYATKILNGSVQKKNLEATLTFDNKQLRRWNVFASKRPSSPDFDLVTENRHTVLTLLGAIGIDEIKRANETVKVETEDSNKEDVFYIHDEVVSNQYTNCEREFAEQDIPFRRTKSERLPNRKDRTGRNISLRRSNSNIFSYEQRKSLILEDEYISEASRKNDTDFQTNEDKNFEPSSTDDVIDNKETKPRKATRVKSLVHQKRLSQRLVVENPYTETTRL